MGVFDAFLGSLFIGHTVATALWGVTCVQTWTYFTQSKGSQQDPKWMKAMVIAIWVFDTIHEIIIAKSVYDYCVTFFAQPKLLESIPNGAWVQVFLVQITALLVHGFYIFRIWRLSKRNWFFTGPVLLITAAELVAACFDIRAVAISDSWPSILQHTRHFTTLLNALMFTVDISISAVMCYLLARNNSEYERTRSIVKRIMVFTLSTNLITSVCAMLVLITAAVYPEKIIFMPFFIVTSRLYANSIMAALNMRPYLKRGVTGHATTEDSIQLPMWHSASGGTRVGQSPAKTQTTTWNEGEQTMKTMDDPMSPGPYMNVNVHVEKHTRV